VPEAYGGMGLSYICYLACVREISRACAATGIIWATNFHAMKPLIEFGNEEQKSRFLPRIAEGALASLAITEPEAGSDATGMTTAFRPDGDDIIIDGGKTPTFTCCLASGRTFKIRARLLAFWFWKKAPQALRSCATRTRWAPGPQAQRPFAFTSVASPARTLSAIQETG